MNKTLVLAEKPSVGKELARVLNCSKSGNGYLEGKKYIVTWALGHLVSLADPDIYNERYSNWKIEDLPILPSPFKLVVLKKSGKQFNIVKKQMLRNDVDKLIIATDAGREGELVARWIINKIGVRKPIKRLWISSITDKAIREGFKKLKDGEDYYNLYISASTRAEADWIVGINATRALTCKYNAQLSCGRVQTPTLAIIDKRENEINSFQPKKYYGIEAISKNLKLIWEDNKTKNNRCFNESKLDEIIKSLNKNNFAEVIDVKKVSKKSFPPKLYDLTDLQRDANRIFGFSAKETLSIMQRLYENYKILTYPRTDSRYITSDIVDTLKDRINACGVGTYTSIASKTLRNPLKINKSFVDNSKVSDHHAIIPTEETVILSSLSDNERKIYDLVVKRFLAVLQPPLEYEQTTITVKIEEEIFTVKGKIIKNQGWKIVYQDSIEGEDDNTLQSLPQVIKSDIIKLTSINKTIGETKPPSPFNEGTLLTAMENPIKYMSNENKDLIKTIENAGGIGTVATRADVIEKLFNSFLIEKKGNDIFMTSKGKQLLKLVPEDLKSPALTAKWEQKLESISKGKLDKNLFINEMKNYTKAIIKDINESQAVFKHNNLTKNRCPQCNKFLLEVKGKKGKMHVCQDRECGYKKGIAKITNARCPNCHKKMELHGEGEGKIFICKCGFREKLSTFNKKKENKGKKISKGEVNRFIKKQKKEEPQNTALADALAKLKFDE